jgi:hypothetical protein
MSDPDLKRIADRLEGIERMLATVIPVATVSERASHSVPDEKGRATLFGVESVRPALEASLVGKNATIPPVFYFGALASLPGLTESQHAHIVMNTGTNTRLGYGGRGRAVDVMKDPVTGRWQETGDTQMDAWVLSAHTAEEAVEEVIRMVAVLASHTDGGSFDDRGD